MLTGEIEHTCGPEVDRARAQRWPLTERARVLATQIAGLQAELASLVGRLSQERTPEAEVPGDMTPTQWLALECGLTRAEAERSLRLGRRLASLPGLSDAFASGAISEGTADLLAQVATPANEAELLDTARVATSDQLRSIVREYKRATAEPGPGSDDREADTFVRWWSDTGRLAFRGDVHAELGTKIDAALRDATERDRAERDDASPDERDDLRREERPRLSPAGALESIIDTYLSRLAGSGGTLPERFLSHVHLDADRLDSACIAGSAPLDATAAARLACESIWQAVVFRHGQPVTATSAQRVATPHQRAAVHARDRRCVFPGCGRTQNLHVHHIVWHSHGGPTHLDNLCCVCTQHHRLIHQEGWRLHGTPNDGLTFTRPDGSTLARRPRPPTPEPLAPPPDPDARWLPSGDRLTTWALDVTLAAWLDP